MDGSAILEAKFYAAMHQRLYPLNFTCRTRVNLNANIAQVVVIIVYCLLTAMIAVYYVRILIHIIIFVAAEALLPQLSCNH